MLQLTDDGLKPWPVAPRRSAQHLSFKPAKHNCQITLNHTKSHQNHGGGVLPILIFPSLPSLPFRFLADLRQIPPNRANVGGARGRSDNANPCPPAADLSAIAVPATAETTHDHFP